MATKQQNKNTYEAIIVLNPNMNDNELDKSISEIESAIQSYSGNIIKTDELQKRRLTHKIDGNKDGIILSIHFNSPPEAPNTFKRTLSINDNVLRHIIIRKSQ